MQLRNRQHRGKYFDSRGKHVPLQKQIMSSGESSIWQGPEPNVLAKIYHEPSLEKTQKLQMMVDKPPQDPTKKQGHLSIAWPQDLLYNQQKEVVGFLMPKITKAKTLNFVYNPKLRRQNAGGFNWYYLHTACMNIAWILHALHEKGYVIGDIKTDNFLVTPHALVSVLDTDSFQIKGFACPVGSEGFTPAELIDKDLESIERLPDHDAFGLAVILFLLLFGYHPFSGAWMVEGSPMPSRDFLIKEGIWVYGSDVRLKPGPYSLPLSTVHPDLETLFRRAFDMGHTTPSKRPSPKEWICAFQKALKDLQMCDAEANHFYYSGDPDGCPWCKLKDSLGLDLFPTPKDFVKDAFLVHKRFEKAQKEGDDRELMRLWQDPSAKMLLQKDEAKKLGFDQASYHQKFLNTFQRAFVSNPHDDDQLLSLWESCKSFGRSIFAKERRDNLDGRSPNLIMQGVFSRRQSLRDILLAIDAKPTDFMKVYGLWKDVDQKSHPLFKPHLSMIESSLALARNYQTMLKSVEKNEIDKVGSLWDERLFANQARKDGLHDKIRDMLAFTTKLDQIFEPFNNSIYRTPGFLNVKWLWGNKALEAMGAYVAVGFTDFPKTPMDVVSESFSRLVSKDQFLDQKGVWFEIPTEFQGDNPFVSVWPARKNCDHYTLGGDALHLRPSKKEKLTCSFVYTKSSWKAFFLNVMGKHNLTVKLCADRDVDIPDMDVVAAFGRPPVSFSQDTLSLGVIQATSLRALEERSYIYPLPKWFHEGFELALLGKDKEDDILRDNGPNLNIEVYYDVT